MAIKPPPRWDCRDPKDQKHLEDWTNAQLKALDDAACAAADDAADAAYDPKRDPFYFYHPTIEMFEKEQLKRRRVIRAARAGDHETAERLADTEELLRLRLSFALKRHKRGREKGDPRPLPKY
jgi:hypothetical protein